MEPVLSVIRAEACLSFNKKIPDAPDLEAQPVINTIKIKILPLRHYKTAQYG
jgi:hypothetical protein